MCRLFRVSVHLRRRPPTNGLGQSQPPTRGHRQASKQDQSRNSAAAERDQLGEPSCASTNHPPSSSSLAKTSAVFFPKDMDFSLNGQLPGPLAESTITLPACGSAPTPPPAPRAAQATHPTTASGRSRSDMQLAAVNSFISKLQARRADGRQLPFGRGQLANQAKASQRSGGGGGGGRNGGSKYLKATDGKQSSSQFRQILQVRLAKMSFYLILLWMISWTPLALLAFTNSLLECRRATGFHVFLASIMTKLGPTFDVYIYGISHPKIRTRFKQIIKQLTLVDLVSRLFSNSCRQSSGLEPLDAAGAPSSSGRGASASTRTRKG